MLIRSKILAVNGVILTAGLIVFGYFIFAISDRSFIAALEEELLAKANTLLDRNGIRARIAEDGFDFELIFPADDDSFFYAALCDAEGRAIKQAGNHPPDLDLSLSEQPDGKNNYYEIIYYGGRHALVLTIPLFNEQDLAPSANPQPVAFLRVGRFYDPLFVFDRVWYLLLTTTVAAVFLSTMLGGVALYYILKPLDELARAVLRIYKSDDLSTRMPDFGESDEIGRLTLLLNRIFDRVESLFRMQQRMLTDVSHELRTPLTTIQGNLELMERMGGYHPDMLADAQDDVSRMTRLVDDLMLLVRADVGGLPIQRQPVQLDTVFLDVFRRMKPLATCVDLTVEDLDQVCVLGDADRLNQLILNLVDNGLKYTPSGGKVSMSLSKLNGTAQVVVADTGIGIESEDLPRIFDRFYRADKARTRTHGGSGLGLSIVRWLVEAHKGRIEVDSKVGEGTKFTVLLPVSTPHDGKQW